MTQKYFDCNARNDGQNWLICWTGTDRDGKNYNVETYLVHASELYSISGGAKFACILGLLVLG